MTKRRGAALALVVVLLMGIQHYGLEREAETRTEAPLKQLKGLPASDVLPTYVASLFFGAFRAVAVDILWIQLRRVEEERRWYERREIIKLISYVQPRNPEVWSHLGWHSAYNVANGFTDPKKSWEWVRFGLTWLRRGVSTLPQNPYLKDQLAYTLWHKVAWKDGTLDMDLMRRIEEDAALQAELLPEGYKIDHPMSAFEIAIPWLERAREELLTQKFELTQMGLYLYPDTMDGYIRLCMMLQGMYEWKRNRPEEAKAWFRKAKQQCDDIIARGPDSPLPAPGGRKYQNLMSTIFADWSKFYAKYPDIVDLELKARSGRREDELALMKTVQDILLKYGPLDEQWLWSRTNPLVLLNRVKVKLTGGEDLQEFNDSFETATEFPLADPIPASLAPEGFDADFYAIRLSPPEPAEGESPLEKPPKPIRIRLKFERPPGPLLPLKVTVLNGSRKQIQSGVLAQSGTLDTIVAEYGRYFVKIESGTPDVPWAGNTRYVIDAEIGPQP